MKTVSSTPKKVVVLSDMWGRSMAKPAELLLPLFDIKYYDLPTLAGIDVLIGDQDAIHQQWVSFGIDKAIQCLIQQETEPAIYLGCSVGGLVAWKAALQGLPVVKLLAFSSTRLRFETLRPSCPFKLYFGNEDVYRPNEEWIHKMGHDHCHIISGDHEFYLDEIQVKIILDKLIAEHWIE